MAPHAQRQHAGPTALTKKNVKKKTNKTAEAGVAVDRRATGSDADATSTEGAEINAPRARRSTATPRRTRSEILRDYWRDVKSGKRTRNEKPAELPPDPNRNPLLDLPEAERVKLYVLLRDCPLMETVQMLLEERGIFGITREQVDDFFVEEGLHFWEVRSLRAATEANALVRFAEQCDENIPAGILAALGQETFRQVTRGTDPAAITRFATLFLKVRSDNRADEMQGLKRRKVEHDLGDDLHAAYRKLAQEVDRCPAAQEHFDALQRALAENTEAKP